jgi:hypothetical protein
VTEHLVDTEIKLGQCNRCQAYVFMAMASGVRSAADPAPVDRNRYIAALTQGLRLFRLIERAGRPYKLQTRRPADLEPSFDPAGAQTGSQRLLAEHGCGGHQRNMITFTEVEQRPPSAHAKPGSSRVGGSLPEAAPGAETNPFVAASHVNPHPSEPYPKCGICSRYIRKGESHWGIQHGVVWVYAEHEDCP